MLRVKMLFSLAVICVLVMAGSAQAVIPVSWVQAHQYTLGDAESGVIGGVAANPAIDSVGGANLTLTGAPLYAAGSATPIAVDFTNADTLTWSAATEYYRSLAFDWNPVDVENWGITFDVRVDRIPPAAGWDPTRDFVCLGAYFVPGFAPDPGNIILGNTAGVYSLTAGGGWFTTGVPIIVGTWDSIELSIVAGIMDVSINGIPVGFNINLAGSGFDPSAGLVIGAAETGGGLVPSRGADATIDEVVFYNVPEPATLILLGLGALALHRRKR